MPDLSRKRERERLRVRRGPYWQRLDKGKYLGLRRNPGVDTWHVRLRDRSGTQHHHSLGPMASYDEAKKAAEKWLTQAGSAPMRHVLKGTVRHALEAYLRFLKDQGREATAKTVEPKFRLTVWSHPMADIRLAELTLDDFRDWRDSLRKGRKPQSFNRIVRDVQAALNRALKEGFIGNSTAWKVDPIAETGDNAGATTATFLTPRQRKAIINSASPEGGQFYRGLELTGARPHELAAAQVRHVVTRGGDTYIELCHKKGKPPVPHWRSVLLSTEGARFFSAMAKGRPENQRLFRDPRGKIWNRHAWADEFHEARSKVNAKSKCQADRIPEDRIPYSFRHSRISELLQKHKIDPLTVAKQAGTSIRMLERTYYNFLPEHYREQIRDVDRPS